MSDKDPNSVSIEVEDDTEQNPMEELPEISIDVSPPGDQHPQPPDEISRVMSLSKNSLDTISASRVSSSPLSKSSSAPFVPKLSPSAGSANVAEECSAFESFVVSAPAPVMEQMVSYLNYQEIVRFDVAIQPVCATIASSSSTSSLLARQSSGATKQVAPLSPARHSRVGSSFARLRDFLSSMQVWWPLLLSRFPGAAEDLQGADRRRAKETYKRRHLEQIENRRREEEREEKRIKDAARQKLYEDFDDYLYHFYHETVLNIAPLPLIITSFLLIAIRMDKGDHPELSDFIPFGIAYVLYFIGFLMACYVHYSDNPCPFSHQCAANDEMMMKNILDIEPENGRNMVFFLLFAVSLQILLIVLRCTYTVDCTWTVAFVPTWVFACTWIIYPFYQLNNGWLNCEDMTPPIIFLLFFFSFILPLVYILDGDMSTDHTTEAFSSIWILNCLILLAAIIVAADESSVKPLAFWLFTCGPIISFEIMICLKSEGAYEISHMSIVLPLVIELCFGALFLATFGIVRFSDRFECI